MDTTRALELIASVRTATLATVAVDGRPRLVPIVFAVLGDGRLASAVDHKPKRHRRLARLDDIRRDDRVTLLFDRYSDDWSGLWWVRVDARASVVEQPPEGAAEALTVRYPQYTAAPPAGPWILMTPIRVTGWEASPAG